MPSSSLIAFQEKLAADPQLQAKFVTALSRFTKAVMDSGKENGHVFESQDVFRFIQGTYLPASGQAGAENVFVKLFVQAAGKSSVASQLSTLSVGQNSELLDALSKSGAGRATSQPGTVGGEQAVADVAVGPASPEARGEDAGVRSPDVESMERDGSETLHSPPVGSTLSSSEDFPKRDGDSDEAATAWRENSGDSDAEWNQARSPWWKFW